MSMVALISTAHGQSVAPVNAGNDSQQIDDEVVEMNVFEVSSAKDRGYLAGNSLAGSRTATDLKNLAASASVFTEQFMEDIGITNTDQLTAFMLSTDVNAGEEAGPQNMVTVEGGTYRMRGLPGGSTTINFFKSGLRHDTFSLDRVDQARGPNSILFGIGAPGGLINVTTKRALLNRNRGSLILTGKSWRGLRAELDYNQVIVGGKLGFRFAAVHSEEDSWRNWEYDKQDRIYGTLKWQITPSTQFNVEIEKGHINKSTKRTYTAFDAYTPWAEGGKNLSTTANEALGIQVISNGNYPVYDTETGVIQNWIRKTSSFRRVSEEGLTIAMTDFSVLPKETVVYGSGYDQITDYTRIMATLTKTFFRRLSIELAGYYLKNDHFQYDPDPNASLYLLVDTNEFLPNGEPNTNAGKTYLEGLTLIKDTKAPSKALRISMSYMADLKVLGRHTIAAVGQLGWAETDNVTLGERIISNPYNTASPENPLNRVRRRTYVDINGPTENIVMSDWRLSPIIGMPVVGANATQGRDAIDTAFIPFNTATQILTDTNTTMTAMIQSSFIKDRLHTVFGASQDHQRSYVSTLDRGEAFGNFDQGIYYAKRGTVPDKFTVNNVTFNGVFHLTNWLGISYNQSANAALPGGGLLDTPNGRPPTPHGKSKDYGIRLDLFNHRVYMTMTYFKTSATKNGSFDSTMVRGGDINHIWNALDDAGVLAANGLLLDKVLNRTTITTYDSDAEGYEFELIANVTDNFRIFANYNDSDLRRKNIGEEMRAYIAANRSFWTGNADVPMRNPDIMGDTVGDYLVTLDKMVVSGMDLPEGGLIRGQLRRKGNLRMTYDFTSGFFKGLRIGAGMRYNGKAVTSYTAEMDPLTGEFIKNAYYRKPQTYFDANLGYAGRFKLGKKQYAWSIQLNINNVFDKDDIIPLITSGDGGIVTYSFPRPREFIVKTKINF
jgi:outer membrane receptor protein involved in Fe transport